MESIVQHLLRDTEVDDISIEICTSVLQGNWDFNVDNLTAFVNSSCLKPTRDLIFEIFEDEEWISATSKDYSTGVLLKKLGALSLALVKKCSEPSEKILALSLLLKSCSHPASLAFGVVNNYVLKLLFHEYIQVISSQMNQLHDTNSEPPPGKSKRNNYKSKEEDSENDSTIGDDSDQFNNTSEGEDKFSTELELLQQSIREQLQLFLERNDKQLLDDFVESQVAVICFAAWNGSLSTSSEIAVRIVLEISTPQNETLPDECADSVSALFRCLARPFTMRSLCGQFSIPKKYNLTVHSATAKVVVRYITDVLLIKDTMAYSRADENSNDTPWLPVEYACVVSLLEKMVLGCAERAPARAVAVQSVRNVLEALAGASARKEVILKSVRGGRGKRAQSSNKEISQLPHVPTVDAKGNGGGLAPHQSLSLHWVRESLLVFFKFISTLSISVKLNQRALALEILSAVLHSDELLEFMCPSIDELRGLDHRSVVDDTSLLKGSTLPTMAKDMFTALLDRCMDTSSSIRMTALACLTTLFEISHTEAVDSKASKRVLRNLLQDAVTVTERADDQSLWTVLLSRTEDEKPSVRSKAILCLYAALSLLPKDLFSQTSSQTDLCVQVFGEKCSDDNMTVRKHAMAALSDLLLTRPDDVFIQELWVTHVLPLAYDSERTIQTHLAKSVNKLIIEAILAWSDENTTPKPGRNSSSERESVKSLGCAPVWGLCMSTVKLSRAKMLSASFATLIKNELLECSYQRLIECLIRGCQWNLCVLDCDYSSPDVGQSEENLGCWLVLESLLLGATSLPTGDKNGRLVLDAGWKLKLSSFAIEMLTNTHIRTTLSSNTIAPSSLCTNGTSDFGNLKVRIFHVVQTLAPYLTPKEFDQVTEYSLQSLKAFDLPYSTISAIMSTLGSLCVNSGQVASEARIGTIRRLFRPLLVAIHWILHTYIWLEKPKDVPYEGSISSEDMPWISSLYEVPGDDWCRRGSLSSFPSTSDRPTERLHHMTCTALHIFGELAMMGFNLEDENCTRIEFSTQNSGPTTDFGGRSQSRESSSFQLVIPNDTIILVQLLMLHRLPASGRGMPSTLAEPNHTAFGDISRVSLSESGLLDTSYFDLPDEARDGSQSDPAVRALAFLAIGKLCLRDRNLAKEHVNVFLRELNLGIHRGDEPNRRRSSFLSLGKIGASSVPVQSHESVRSNSLLILGDICVRYTNFVDRHVGKLSRTLGDPSPLVRNHAFVLLNQLLLQEYVKLKGMLFFRFLALVVDTDPDLAAFARIALRKTLHSKFPTIFAQHISDAMIIFNGCVSHPIYVAAASDGANDTADLADDLRLSGSECRLRRFEIYEYLAERYNEEERISATVKLVQDVLAYAVEKLEPSQTSTTPKTSKQQNSSGLNKSDLASTEELVEDVFLFLQSSHLHLQTKGTGSHVANEADMDLVAEEVDDLDTGNAPKSKQAALLARAKSKVLQKLSLQHLVDHLLPVVCSLKRVLESRRSRLQKHLMQYLTFITKSFPNEVAQVWNGDPILKSEIQYDLKLFEREQNRRKTMNSEEEISKDMFMSSRAEEEEGARSDRRRTRDGSYTSPPHMKPRQGSTVKGVSSITAPSLKKNLSFRITSQSEMANTCDKSQHDLKGADDIDTRNSEECCEDSISPMLAHIALDDICSPQAKFLKREAEDKENQDMNMSSEQRQCDVNVKPIREQTAAQASRNRRMVSVLSTVGNQSTSEISNSVPNLGMKEIQDPPEALLSKDKHSRRTKRRNTSDSSIFATIDSTTKFSKNKETLPQIKSTKRIITKKR